MPAFSGHHPSNMRSWIYTEILRLRRTTYLFEDFECQIRFFFSQLRVRGYSLNTIQDVIDFCPDPLLSTFSLIHGSTSLKPIVANDGQILVDAPPKIFRAPFSFNASIPFGPIVRENFHDVIEYLDSHATAQRGGGSSNPNPKPLTLANMHPKTLWARLKSKSQHHL